MVQKTEYSEQIAENDITIRKWHDRLTIPVKAPKTKGAIFPIVVATGNAISSP